ncbi:hypothetical protein BO70DRAFT_207716 [Aspergillus heteromorphus CBS 117.55]|uniref:SNARE-complex protein Syntaxin-18 N-terminal domain-containing protein n=1 Tax=Aspergillus heteromorphus CBS 117.55 TaxID=1448321 RepID=A0A317URC4_9EURO|nr:uncharacterized protein BO70DRAFT_207716 [Aspergillus heteromorphus CBS 117.55]PWY64271.1 hypothetical protein BO70DRAFT_207716 [Aspergillus heteromorphus CBS 117.55]
MTDLTPTLGQLLQGKSAGPKLSEGYITTEIADEFLKEAYRINTHITSLLQYLQTIRPAYLSLTKPSRTTTANSSNNNNNNSSASPTSPSPSTTSLHPAFPLPSLTSTPNSAKTPDLPDTTKDQITTSTSSLLTSLSSSINTLSSAETLRQETAAQVLNKRFRVGLLALWAGGNALTSSTSDGGRDGGHGEEAGKSEEEQAERRKENTTKCVRESVLWFLRARLEAVVVFQREMVERRVERVRERERSVLYLSEGGKGSNVGRAGQDMGMGMGMGMGKFGSGMGVEEDYNKYQAAARIDADEVQAIEKQLTPQQLQLFAEENDSMVKYFEDVVGKVQNAEKSLLEISSLQQTLVSHLATQEEYIGQLVTDAGNTSENIGDGNKELKRASERRSAAQAVFWGTVGLCTWLVVWDLVF